MSLDILFMVYLLTLVLRVCQEPMFGGTFVELPSQFMENFAVEKDFLRTFAFHYQTGEPIPDDLIERMVKSRNFMTAYACLRQVSFGLLDMAYYTQKKPFQRKTLFPLKRRHGKRLCSTSNYLIHA